MATTTPRIGLTKPDGTDLVDIAVLNTNFDKIDSNIASTKIQSTKPTTANAGDLWWDSDTGTLYLYYTDANSSQWVAATSDPINIGVVASQAERDAQYPTPAQGMAVYRTDLGYTQRYYGLFNGSTNPAGRNPAGWYKEAGQIVQVVSAITTTPVQSTSSSFVDTGLSVTITPTSTTSKLLAFVSQTGGHGAGDGVYNLQVVRDSTNLGYMAALSLLNETNNYLRRSHSLNTVVDSGSIAATTFKTRIQRTSGTAYVEVNPDGIQASIIVVEVSA